MMNNKLIWSPLVHDWHGTECIDVPRLCSVAYSHEQARMTQGLDEQTLWHDIVAGRWSLLAATTLAGSRYVVVRKNPDAVVTLRALRPREQSVMDFVLAGRSGKWIALELQLSQATVTRALSSGLRKLGVANLGALAGVRTARFVLFSGLIPEMELAIARLTTATVWGDLSYAERSVIMDFLDGKCIAAIARGRDTSPHTVANQIASAYRKLGISSRRELVALQT
jgi:DNA-binding NarL/FixJ family response regulator